MLADLQIEHINNKTCILTVTYFGKNRSGDSVFQIRDPTLPAPTPEQMAAVGVFEMRDLEISFFR